MSSGPWHDAEQALFDHLVDGLGASPDETAFVGELPFPVPAVSDLAIWAVDLGGEEEDQPFLTPTGVPNMCYQLRGRIIGLFTSRAAAQKFYTDVRMLVPAGPLPLVGNILRADVASPRLDRGVYPVNNGLEEGGEQRFWGITIPLHVTFTGAVQDES